VYAHNLTFAIRLLHHRVRLVFLHALHHRPAPKQLDVLAVISGEIRDPRQVFQLTLVSSRTRGSRAKHGAACSRPVNDLPLSQPAGQAARQRRAA